MKTNPMGLISALSPDFLSQKTRKSFIASIESKLEARSSKLKGSSSPLSAFSFELSAKGRNWVAGTSRFRAFLIVAAILYSVSFIHATSFSQPIIIDHTCTDLTRVPDYWIHQAKGQLRTCYGHTSHGSQPITGMEVLMNADPSSHLYDFNTDGAVLSGVLSIEDAVPDGDLGHEGDTSWAERTRCHLDGAGSDRNVVVWSWCGGVSDNTAAGINAYLSAMSLLEQEYPDVTFVYMTGHLDGTGATGNLHIRNNQ